VIRHDSYNSLCRSKQAACVCGEKITLRLLSDEAFDSVLLRLWVDGKEILHACTRDKDGYACTITLPGAPCLVWYFFILQGAFGTRCYGAPKDNLGGEGRLYSHEPPSFQITVYDESFETPKWMRESVMMQILPDRFAASRPIGRRKPPHGGKWHKDWYEPPILEIRNGDNAANDYYGGDLKGIEQKLPYLKGLGIDALYLNPIFEASSNHGYNTRNYRKIDPAIGTEEDFRRLAEKALEFGIRIVLDGVFSHTGDDSVYFESATANPKSPYKNWYTFHSFPDDYECWWGFRTLPTLNKDDPSCREFLLSVCEAWLKKGASGWRLDVADELPMSLLRDIRKTVKGVDPDRCVIGEVWEDASNKIAYGQQRCYCAGDTLDSVMNYPLRDILLSFMLGYTPAKTLRRHLLHMRQCYPEPFLLSLMNLLGSHDKARVISVLADAGNMQPDREHRRVITLTDQQYALGRQRFVACWRFLCALPGMPCMYYGDEAGLYGMTDPFCRASYPWGREDMALLEKIREINLARKRDARLQSPVYSAQALSDDVLLLTKDGELSVVLNRGNAPFTYRGNTVSPISCAVVHEIAAKAGC
jgi:cyclomaltodextrinase